VNTASPSPFFLPTPPPVAIKSVTNANVNVNPKKENGDIEQKLLDETVKTLGGTRRLGLGATTTVSLWEEQEEQQEQHRQLRREETIEVPTGSATIVVEYNGGIDCENMYGSRTPPAGRECRDFIIIITLTGGDQDDVDELTATVDAAINAGTFTTDVGFCTVLVEDQVDASCTVVTPEPTITPTESPTEEPVVTDSPTTDAPTTSPTSEKPVSPISTASPSPIGPDPETPSPSSDSSGDSSGSTPISPTPRPTSRP